MNFIVGVFILAVADVLAVEGVVLIQWLVGTKAVSIDGQRLALVAASRDRMADLSVAFAG